jgi:hypothetical protein
MTFRPDLATPDIPPKYGSPMDIYQFHVVVFFFSLSPSFPVTILIFRITTPTLPYDLDDYMMHARIYFLLCPRHDDILNLYMFVQFYR